LWFRLKESIMIVFHSRIWFLWTARIPIERIICSYFIACVKNCLMSWIVLLIIHLVVNNVNCKYD
jgi:hypothetical protein